jgi:hypothetical protein
VSAYDSDPRDVVAVHPIDGGHHLRVVFECGAGVVLNRDEAARLVSDPEAAARFLRRHTAWAMERERRRR